MESPLFTRFIKTKLNAYQEPTRQGTRKGCRVGLSKIKYEAALLCLTRAELKEIAAQLGISYGLLRKWRTETEFVKAIKELADEFFLVYQVAIEDMHNDFNNRLSLTVEKTHIKDMPNIPETQYDTHKMFSDANDWGKPVVDAIKRNTPKWNKHAPIELLPTYFDAMSAIFSAKSVYENKYIYEAHKTFYKNLCDDNLLTVMEELSEKAQFNETERKQLILLLLSVKRILKQI